MAGRSTGWAWTAAFAVGAVAWAGLWGVAFFPGEATLDTWVQYQQGLTGAFSDAHPVLYALLLGASGQAFGDGRLVLFLQLGLGTLGLVLLAHALRDRNLLARLALVVLALNPLMWAQWGILWKDEAMATSYLVALGLFGLGRPLPAIPLLVAACCFRHNGITLVLPLAVLMGWVGARRYGRWRGWGLALGVLVLCAATPRLLDRAVDAERTYAAAPSLVFDLAGIWTREPDLYRASPYAERVSFREVRRRHRAWSARKITSDRRGLPGLRHKDLQTPEAWQTLRDTWRDAVLARPGAWLAHRYEYGCWFVNVCMDGPFEAIATTRDRYAADMGIPDRRAPLYRALHPVREAFQVLGRGWIWIGLVLLPLGLALWRRRWVDVAIAASALCYLIGNLLLAPSAPFRYHLPLMMAAVVLLPRMLVGQAPEAAPRSSVRGTIPDEEPDEPAPPAPEGPPGR